VKNYDVEPVDDNAIQEATYLSLVERNQKLESQIVSLEDQLFSVEETLIGLQRKLILTEEDVADAQALLQQRETRNQEDKRELAERQTKIDDETERQNELDSEKRAFDARITILEVEVEQTNCIKKLESAIQDLETLGKDVVELTAKNQNFLLETENKNKDTIEFEKKLTNKISRSFTIRAKAVAELDKMVLSERKRAQESLEYVRETLKDRIQGLELQLKSLDSTSSSRTEKRKLEREVKKVTRSIEQGNEQSAENARTIESFEKQLSIVKERTEKVTIEKAGLEKESHKLDQTIRDLKSRLEIVHETNAKFIAAVPQDLATNIEEEANSQTNDKKKIVIINIFYVC